MQVVLRVGGCEASVQVSAEVRGADTDAQRKDAAMLRHQAASGFMDQCIKDY